MKKILASALTAVMVLAALAGCGASTAAPAAVAETEAETEASAEVGTILTGDEAEPLASLSGFAGMTDSVAGSLIAGRTTSSNTSLVSGVKSLDGAAYVMIYNPQIENLYDNPDSSSKMTTGDLSDQINVEVNRAGGYEEAAEPRTAATSDFAEGLGDLDIQPGSRAGGLAEIVNVGDSSDFYCGTIVTGSKIDYTQETFTCVYVGDHCNIWTFGGALSDTQAANAAKQFDANIYEQATQTFGQARFTEDGSKVNILFYDIPMQGLCGFFRPFDLFSSDECRPSDITNYKLNVDRAIIHINASRFDDLGDEPVFATLSHEFQHLINFTETLESGNMIQMGTWLNEAMSAYAEEMVYPGTKFRSQENVQMYISENFRKGQSLYNFSTQNDNKYGAYGTVFLFEEYLRALDSDSVFSNIHSYWKIAAASDSTDAKALYHSVSANTRSAVDASVNYPANVTAGFASTEDCWMSKLTLNFFLETLSTETGRLDELTPDARDYMIYDEINAAEIEGGGRIIIATQNGSYTIPADADDGLIYVGLDADYNVITDIITKADVQTGSTAAAAATTTTPAASTGTTELGAFSWNGRNTGYVYTPSDDVDFPYLCVDYLEKSGISQTSEGYIYDDMEELIQYISYDLDSSDVGSLIVILPDGVSDSELQSFYEVCNAAYNAGIIIGVLSNPDLDDNAGWLVNVVYGEKFSSLEAMHESYDVDAVAVGMINAMVKVLQHECARFTTYVR